MCDYVCVCVVLCLSSFASVCQSLKPHGCIFWIAPPNISLTLTAAVSALISHWLMPVEFTEGGAEIKCWLFFLFLCAEVAQFFLAPSKEDNKALHLFLVLQM